jgi:tight adherence protein C
MADSRVALANMGNRTGIDGLTRLGTTLIQSMQYGTPLSHAMRVLSAEMRQETLTRFETRAARLGVLLTLPMIVFILPCVFMVVGGPAAVQVFRISG